MNYPNHLKYTQNDEWVHVEGKIGTIGITDFAQSQLSDIVFVEVVVAQGDAVSKKDAVATVESVKAAADVYSPLSGKVEAVNEGLPSVPETINSDPYGAGWMLKIELTDPSELNAMMDSAAYEKYCQEREH